MSALDSVKIDQCIKKFEETFLSINDKFYHECVAKEATEELVELYAEIERLKNQVFHLEKGYELIAEKNRDFENTDTLFQTSGINDNNDMCPK